MIQCSPSWLDYRAMLARFLEVMAEHAACGRKFRPSIFCF
jgi:hypothetical protein